MQARLITADNRRAKELLAENGLVCEDENVQLTEIGAPTWSRRGNRLIEAGISHAET
jgi:hypothetical protein